MALLSLITRPEIEDALVDAIGRGIPFNHAATKAGITGQQLAQWRAVARGATVWPSTGTPVGEETKCRIVHLFERIAEAQASYASTLVTRIENAGQEVNQKTGLSEWRANAWLLEHHPSYKEEWAAARHSIQEITGTIHHEHRVARSLASEDLLESVEAPYSVLPNPEGDSSLKEEGIE